MAILNKNDVDALLDKNKAEALLNEYSKEIFGNKSLIKIREIKRSDTYNFEVYNILYRVLKDGVGCDVRLSTSMVVLKEKDFQALEYFYNNGFGIGNFLVPKPIYFLARKNLLFYKNVDGVRFADALNTDISILLQRIRSSAACLKKIHGLPKPVFPLFRVELFFERFNLEAIAKHFPELVRKLSEIIKRIQQGLQPTKFLLCHGDFNPNNIIFRDKEVYVIDFGLTCIFEKEIDLASFLAHLKFMLKKNNRSDAFDCLNREFLKNYGEFDQKKLDLLEILIYLRLLEITILYPWFYDNDKYSEFLYLELKEKIQDSLSLNV